MKRVLLAAEIVTECGNSFPYNFVASAVLLELEEEIGILITNMLYTLQTRILSLS